MADFFAKGKKPINGYGGGNLASKSDLTSIFESGTTASQAISTGTYFYLDGTLVRAKVDIASGATFTENTNYEVITAGALNNFNWKYLAITKTEIGNSAVKVPISKDLTACKMYFVEYEIAGGKTCSIPMASNATTTLLESFGNAIYHVYANANLFSTFIQCAYTSKGSTMTSYPLYITGIYYME